MVATIQGLVQGNTIVLDEAVPELAGKRVRVTLEPVEEPTTPTREQRAEAWRAWVASGPKGTIKEKADPEFP